MKNKTAVVILLHNRPYHTEQLLKSIAKSRKSRKYCYFIFCDGPKTVLDQKKIKEIKILLNSFGKNFITKVKFRKKNVGLFQNVTSSINFVFRKYKKAIILEDDLIVNKNFFEFIDKSLNKYENFYDVLQVSGYSYPVFNNKKHYFLSLTSCWGWGITKQNWKKFFQFLNNYKLLKFNFLKIKKSKTLKYSFNYNGTYNYFLMLEKFFKNKISSWGIIFYLYLFINKKVTLFPNVSLVQNIGFDGSGYHKSKNNIFNKRFKKINRSIYPKKIAEDKICKKKIEDFFKTNLSIYAKIKNKIYEKLF